ncbi:MAG: autotransporter-associated beta strand repeat-containing protein, partial [Thermaurantiacus sp.]
MKRFLMSAATALAASVLVASGAADANTLFFQINPNFDTGGQRQVFIFGQPGTTGSVIGASGFNQTFDLGVDGFIVVTVPTNQELSPGVVQDRGFRVEATNPISGYLLNRRPQSTDMAFLINGDRLGTDYFTLGYQNIQQDQISVQATQDNTTVTFRRPDGTTTTQTLNAGQTFMLTASAQLTGTRVTADRPIAVFSGNRCTNVPTGITACDHIVEQMPPTDALSRTYYLAQTPRTGTQGNVFRAVATQDGTEVRVNGAVVATLNTGQFFEGRVAGGIELTANNPILVGQYLIGQSQAGANTDPAMTIVPGQDQWLSSYVFSPPAGTANFPTDFVSIVIGTADISTLLLDGLGVDSGLFQQLSTTNFSFGNIDVSAKTGPFSISAANPFQLLLSGFDNFDSYLTYGGAAFAPGASPPPEEPPPPPPPPPSTVLFWDGDRDGNANNNVVDGGDGVLTRTSTNITTADGSVNLALPVAPITLVFAGEPGNVEIDTGEGPIRLLGLRFDIDGYRLFGDEIELVGPNSMLRVGDGTDEGAAYVARIESVLTGDTRVQKTDLGTLVLTGANSYSGGTDVVAGTLIGNSGTFGAGGVSVAEDATLVFDQMAAGMFMNGIAGDGALVKRGSGTLVLLGDNPLAGPTTVEAGRLDVVGNLGASAVTVGSGATLGGIGTVGATRIGAGGTVAPGLSIGTITVEGDFVQASGSTYVVELNAAGQSDRIIATGTATVEPTTTLRVVRLGMQRLALGTRYTVLTGEGGRTGSYSTLTGDTRVSRFISLVQELDANNVYLGVRQTASFASAGRTPNQIAAASGADSTGNGSLYNAIVTLQTDAEAEAAFDAISGEIHASARGAALEDSRFVREAVLGRLAGMDERAVWMQAYGAWGTFDGDGNAA